MVFYVLHANSGRYTDALVSYIAVWSLGWAIKDGVRVRVYTVRFGLR